MSHKFTYYGELYSSKRGGQIFKNKRTGKPFIMKNANAKRQEADFAKQLKEQLHLWGNPTNYPLYVEFKIFRKTHRPFDYTNIVQNLQDAMTRAGYIPDDCMKYLIPVFVPYEKDKENPRCEVRVINVA